MLKAKNLSARFKNATAGTFGYAFDLGMVLAAMVGFHSSLMNAFANAFNVHAEPEFEPNPQNMFQYEFLALLRTSEDINALKAEHKSLLKDAIIERLGYNENNILKPEKIKTLISAAVNYLREKTGEPYFTPQMAKKIYNDINLRFYGTTDAQFKSDARAFYEWHPAGGNSRPQP